MTNILFIAVMYSSEDLLDKAKKELIQKYGKIKAESNPYNFSFTDYYEPEMGKNLKKIFLIFEKEISEQDLAGIKFFITEIEKKLSIDEKRTVNIDPGYLSETELVLATFKEKSFKEKIHDKVWVHKVLEFDNSKIIQFFHTFADYKDKKNQEFIIENKPI